MLKKFWENYITSGIKKDKQSYDMQNIIFVNTFSIIGISNLIIFGIIYLSMGYYFIGVFELTCGMIGLLNIMLLRVHHNIKFAEFIIISGMFLVLIVLFVTGEYERTGIYWAYTYPTLCFFLQGKKRGFFWITFFFLAFIIIIFLKEIEVIKYLPYSLINIRQMLFSLFAVSLLVFFYQKVRDDNEKVIQKNNEEIFQKKIMDEHFLIAEDIQRSLIPQENLLLDHIDIVGFYKAAQGVGGDYYDFVQIDEDRVAVIISDVSGKSIPAALMMVNIRAAFRTIINQKDLSPKEIVDSINYTLSKDLSTDMFATLFFFIYNQKTHELIFTNAGHGPLVFYSDKEKKVMEIDSVNMPIGINLKKPNYKDHSIILEPNDIIMLFTDGIFEATNRKQEDFGLSRLYGVLQANSHLTAERIKKIIVSHIHQFLENTHQDDDIALVIAKIKS